jgi:hypothetical protein
MSRTWDYLDREAFHVRQ